MDRIEITEFTNNDIPFGKMLTDLEGWHRTAVDWSRVLRIEPFGMMKARLGGKDVGIAGVLSYNGVSWIHSVIVLSELRRRGIGRTLMEACIARARESGNQCIMLDSVPGFEGFYRSLGFVEQFESRRFLRDGASFSRVAEEIRASDIDDILAFDRAMIGIDRERVLRAVLEDSAGLAFRTKKASRVSGYVLAREGEERIQIGPCIIDKGDYSVARRLITTLMGSVAVEKKFRMCVPGMNGIAIRLAQDLEFTSGISSTRMVLGGSFQEPIAVFCMISPEKG